MSGKERDPYEILRLISDRQRIEILRELKRKDDLSFSDLWRKTGLQSGRLAFQLKKLKPLLTKTKEDHYTLSENGLKALEVLEYYENMLAIEKPGIYEAFNGKTIVVREAKPEDYSSMVEADCSWVEKWFKPVSKRWVEASYEELTPWERYLRGGPWRDLRTYRTFARFFLKEGGRIFVPEVDGRVVGFMEITFNEEPELFGRFIDTGNSGQTEVHKDFCGIGVGTALLKHLTELANRLGYKAVDFGGSEYERDEFDQFLAKSKLETFNLRAVSVKASTLQRNGKGRLTDLSKTNSLDELLSRRPLTWKLQPVRYVLGVQRGMLDMWKQVEGMLKSKDSGLKAFKLGGKSAAIYLRAPTAPEAANMFVWVPTEHEADPTFLKEVFGVCGDLAREMAIENHGGYIFEEHSEIFKRLGFEIGKEESYTRVLL